MAARTKSKRGAKRTRKPKKIEVAGRPLTPAQRRQLREIIKVVELGIEAIATGVAFSRQTLTKRRR